MARKSFISSLPKDVVLELNDVIRQHEYGDHESNVAWLKQKGFQVSRSAMHRYTAELKARDGFDGSAGSFKLIADLMAKDSNRDLLYQELGQIEFNGKIKKGAFAPFLLLSENYKMGKISKTHRFNR